MGKGGQIRPPKSLGDPLGSLCEAAEWSPLRARLPQRGPWLRAAILNS